MSESNGASPTRSVAQIEAEMATTRARLAGTIDELSVRAQPKEIARRQAQSARAKLSAALTTPEGDLRVDRLAIIAAAVVVLIALRHVTRRRR